MNEKYNDAMNTPANRKVFRTKKIKKKTYADQQKDDHLQVETDQDNQAESDLPYSEKEEGE